jgi:hypothetical protein
MPNDCTNSFTISDITHDQWRDLAATFQDGDEDEQQGFLTTFYPEPDYSITPVTRTHPEIYAHSAKNEEEREQILRNEPTIREDSWRDWRVQHWGTKWDVYDCCNDFEQEVASDEFSANSCTAWAPPSEECLAVISKQFPGSLLTNYYEEVAMDFCGVTVAKNGVARDFREIRSIYREPFLRQRFPELDDHSIDAVLNLKEDLSEFFWDNCDCGEFSDFIRAAQESVVEEMIQQIEEATSVCLVTA